MSSLWELERRICCWEKILQHLQRSQRSPTQAGPGIEPLGSNSNFGTKPLREMLDYSMVRPFRPSQSAKISQLSRKLLSTRRVRVCSTGQVREIAKYMPLESRVGPQSRLALLVQGTVVKRGSDSMDCRSKR
jgi:hypothetical protein